MTCSTDSLFSLVCCRGRGLGILLGVLGWSGLIWAQEKGAAGGGAKRPNIVLAFADDLGRYASAYRQAGVATVNDHLQTPAMDRVAAEGALFHQAFVSVPSCTPSRAALLSGRHFFRNGSHSQLHHPWNGDNAKDPWNEVQGFGLMLAKAGYHIGWTYKMHLSEDRMGGKARNYQAAGRRFNSFSEQVTRAATVEQGKAELLEEVRQNFLSFMGDRKKSDQPFFYWFNPTNTHRPWQRGSGKALWGIDPDRLKGLLPAFLPDVPEVREDFADYLGEVMAFDAAVAVLMEELEKAGMLDNTLLVISGDHGAPGFPRGKTNLYDFGTQVPLIMRLPGRIEAGREVTAPVSLLDLAPTFLRAAGLKPTADMNGQNLLPVLAKGGDETKLRGWVVCGRETHVNEAREGNLPYPQRSIRTRDHLYIVNFKPDRWPVATPPLNTPEAEKRRMDIDFGPTRSWFVTREGNPEIGDLWELGFGLRPAEELYDLSKDPDQLHNLAGLSVYDGLRLELKARLMAELKDNEDPRLNNDAFDRPPYTGQVKKR
jgi:N-sulfoglucosamine sulfohydrolase